MVNYWQWLKKKLNRNVDMAITNAAAANGVDRNILERVVQNESGGNINVGWDRTHTTVGITQMNRLNWNYYSGGQPYSVIEDPANYEQELDATAQMLNHLHKEYGSWRAAMAAYNEGETIYNKVRRGERNLSPITERYISGINT